MSNTLSRSLMLLAFVVLPGIAHAAERPARTQAPYFSVSGTKKGVESLPLKETSADVKIAGVVAQVEVSQVYVNAGEDPIEAVYVFPASTRAAVEGMRMKIGKRTIKAKIQSKKQAAKTYKAARKAGKTASLLEQERPNVFQMRVANIMPGDRVEVFLQYVETLEPTKGVYEFVYPTVVGPRYGKSSDKADAWVANPHSKAAVAPSYTWGMKAQIQSAVAIRSLHSPSHKLHTRGQGNNSIAVDVDDKRGGNRDFILRYRLRGESVETGVLLYPGAKENFFLAMVQPPARITPERLPAREYIFIVDVSGSMSGFPLETTKTLVNKLLKTLKPRDRVNLMTFAGGSQILAPRSLPATPDNLSKVRKAMSALRGGGGTEILSALLKGLAMKRNSDLSTTFVVVTDGYVHVERSAFETISKNLGKANLFAFGVGSSVNRHLIEGMARAGMGEAFVAIDKQEAKKEARRFASYVASPVLTNLKMSFQNFDAYDVVPKNLPDVFSDRPVLVYGKYRGSAKGSLSLRGVNGTGKVKRVVAIQSAGADSKDNRALRSLWARRRIQELNDLSSLGGSSLEPKLTKLGLKYGLMTAYTSFVAVDSRVRNESGQSSKVRQTLPMPKGVPDSAIGCANCGILGTAVGNMSGGWGYGIGGGGGGSMGAGNYGTIGHGAGRGRRVRPPQVQIARVTISGSLSTNLIRRYIRRKIPAVRHCYETQLLQDPKLKGTVTVRFKISSLGKVQGASASGMGNAKVESCVSKVVLGIQFPKVPGGGDVAVRYPFRFQPAKGKTR